jgi:hypothetical protein
MTSLEAIALSKAAAAAAKDLTIAPGDYNVDTTITVRVIGTMKKSKDYDYTPTAEKKRSVKRRQKT